jgi:hypothetical protein
LAADGEQRQWLAADSEQRWLAADGEQRQWLAADGEQRAATESYERSEGKNREKWR